MKLADLSPERHAWLARARWDRIVEKHEGPWDRRSYAVEAAQRLWAVSEQLTGVTYTALDASPTPVLAD